MKILYIGSKDTHEQYVRGIIPSHWLYGAVEMEKEGHEVFWEQEKPAVLNDWKLIRRFRPDGIFIPNLNLHHHLLLLALAAIGLIEVPIFAFLHHEPKVKTGGKSLVYRFLLSGCKHIFFLSEKTMEETISHGLVKREKCTIPGWGPDTDFYAKVEKSEGDYFVSTGKENRDFETLIVAFERTGAPLKIMTAKAHGGNNHEWLVDRCKNIPNIEVVITENTGDVYPRMLQEMAHAKALVCPLRKEKMNYCVGLSTVADAEGLRKPLVITENPYHSANRMVKYNVVRTLDDWIYAVQNLKDKVSPQYSMQTCWQNMRQYILGI